MKKRILVGKIIGVIGLCIFAMGMSYIVTRSVEKARYSDINLLVTFEDTEEFTLENTKKLTKDEALETYPYIFTIENKSKREASFNIVLDDNRENNVARDSLQYIIMKDDKEIVSGDLKSIALDNIIGSGKIKENSKETYKVYIYLTEDIKDASYTYALKIDSK